MLKFIEVKFVRKKPPRSTPAGRRCGSLFKSSEGRVGERRVENTETKLVESALSAGGLE